MDIRAYLREMDHEEEELRMQIMRLQVRIQQLNDARLVLMQREEERAQHLGHNSPFGSLGGGQIVVRDRQKMMPPEKSEPAKASLPAPEPASKQQREPIIRRVGRDHRLGIASVVELIRAEGPMSKPAIIRRLGVASPEDVDRLKKTLSNARTHGYLRRDEEQRYVVATKKKPPSAGGKRTTPDPERSARERQAVIDVLARTGEPMPSGDVLTAAQVILGRKGDKNTRDRLYWALRKLRGDGAVNVRDGLYQLLSKAA